MIFVVFVVPLSFTCISSKKKCVLSCPWLVAWSPGLESVTTTSSPPIEETSPSTLKEDKESSEPEAEVKAYRDLSLLFARDGKRSCTDVGTAMTPDAIMDVVAAEFVFVENDDLDDELMTDEQNNQRYKNNSILTNLTSELDKCANACRHFVVPCRPHNTDRAHESKAVAPVAGALGKRTSVKRNPQTGSRLKSNPVFPH